jgi:hypothetical protein
LALSFSVLTIEVKPDKPEPMYDSTQLVASEKCEKVGDTDQHQNWMSEESCFDVYG